MKITYYGHSCFMLNTGEHRILFDPFISGNELAAGIDMRQIRPDFILLSHGHADHVLDAEHIARNTGATIVSNWEICEWYRLKGLTALHPMNTGGMWEFPFGTVKCVEAVHSSSMPDGSYGGNPMGFVLWIGGKIIYFAGDTALTLNMKLIGEFSPPDIAILPLGSNFTMDIRDAAVAASYSGARQVIGMHFDTFGFIKIDHSKAKDEFERRDIPLVLMRVGESLEI